MSDPSRTILTIHQPNSDQPTRPSPSERPRSAAPLDTTDDQDPSLRPRPLPNSYWATPSLLASEYPGHYEDEVAKPRLQTLIDVGEIRDFVDLTEDWELRPYVNILKDIAKDKGDPWIVEVLNEEDVDVVSKKDNLPATTIRYIRLPVRDGFVPKPEGLRRVMHFLSCSVDSPSFGGTKEGRAAVGESQGAPLARSLTTSAHTIVHCWGGIGRTGTVVGCYLIESGVVESGDVALALIAKKWKGVDKSWRVPRSPETRPQEKMVLGYKRSTLMDTDTEAETSVEVCPSGA